MQSLFLGFIIIVVASVMIWDFKTRKLLQTMQNAHSALIAQQQKEHDEALRRAEAELLQLNKVHFALVTFVWRGDKFGTYYVVQLMDAAGRSFRLRCSPLYIRYVLAASYSTTILPFFIDNFSLSNPAGLIPYRPMLRRLTVPQNIVLVEAPNT